jgi:hypothetical protein
MYLLGGVVFGIILLLAAVGVPLARKFVYGLFHGANLFVVVDVDGKTLVYKNPRELIGIPEEPLDMIPNEILYSERYETYYNVCWFDRGTLVRCGHSYHRKPENALYCDRIQVAGSFVGKVLEER